MTWHLGARSDVEQVQRELREGEPSGSRFPWRRNRRRTPSPGPLSADVRAAAEAIEDSATFRLRFAPTHPLGRLHPAAVEFARLALGTRAALKEQA